MSYPKYQYSVFMKNGRDEQLVIRANTFEELIELKKNIDVILEKHAPAQGLVCKTCGAPAEERSGTSKAGKPWHGIFCSKTKEHVKWL